jgi:hypothetical protein
MNKALGGATGKRNPQKQQQPGLTRELLKIQHGSRPVVLLEGPRNSRMRSSISSMESSPANAALEKYRQQANKQHSATIDKELKEATKKPRTGEPKPFEKLLATAANTGAVSTTSTVSNRNPIEYSKSINQTVNRTVIEEENYEISKPTVKNSKSKPIDNAFDSPIQTSVTSNINSNTGDRFASANVFHFSLIFSCNKLMKNYHINLINYAI